MNTMIFARGDVRNRAKGLLDALTPAFDRDQVYFTHQYACEKCGYLESFVDWGEKVF